MIPFYESILHNTSSNSQLIRKNVKVFVLFRTVKTKRYGGVVIP